MGCRGQQQPSLVRQETLPWVPGPLSHSFSSPDQDAQPVGTCLDQGILIALEFTPLCLAGDLWTLFQEKETAFRKGCILALKEIRHFIISKEIKN